jgi:hypothetical protein
VGTSIAAGQAAGLLALGKMQSQREDLNEDFWANWTLSASFSTVTAQGTTANCPAGTYGVTTTATFDDVPGYAVHAFKASAPIKFSSQVSGVDVLMVGGGGAGGRKDAGGGGGAGAVLFYPGYTVPSGTYTVTVGAGGVTLLRQKTDWWRDYGLPT